MRKKFLAAALILAIAVAFCPKTATTAEAAEVKEPEIFWFEDGVGPDGANLGTFQDGFVCIVRYEDDRCGYAEAKGAKVIIPPEYTWIALMSDGYVLGDLPGVTQLLNTKGEVVLSFDVSEDFDVYGYGNGMIRFSEGRYYNRRFGFMDLSGEVVVPAQYEWAEDFSEGLAAVEKDGKWGFIDTTGAFVIAPQYDYDGVMIPSFSEGLVALRANGKWGFADKTGAVVIALQYDNIGHFTDGLACVYKNGKGGYIDTTGKIVVEPQYDSVEDFADGFAIVGQNDKYGYIDKTGTVIAEPQYDTAEDFIDGLALVSKQGKYGLIDTSGKIVLPLTYDYMDYCGGNVIEVVDNDYSKVITIADGTPLFSMDGCNIRIFEDSRGQYGKVSVLAGTEGNYFWRTGIFENPYYTEPVETLQTGALGDGQDLQWSYQSDGAISFTGDIPQGETVLVACYDDAGRFTGVKRVDRQALEAQVATDAAKLKLFWLGGNQAPRCGAQEVALTP